MKEYFISIATIALVGVATVSMLYGTSNAKYLRLICGLCVIGCIVFPFTKMWDDDFDFSEIEELFKQDEAESQKYDKIYNNSIKHGEISSAETLLKSEIIKEFDVNSEDFDVRINAQKNSGENYSYDIEVKIYPSGIFMNVHAVEKYVNDRLNCECQFYYEF